MKKIKKINYKDRYFFLLIGILIGAFLGFSTVWWHNNKVFVFPLSSKIKKIFTKDFVFFNKNKLNDTIIQKINNKPIIKTKNKINNNNDDLSTQDSIEKLIFNDPAFSEYYFKLQSSNDSIEFDTLYYQKKNELDNEIIIKKDKLIFSKLLTIKMSESEEDKKKLFLDSILLGAKSYKKETNIILVEFWQSPVNFVGYKMSRNKIIIYGLPYDENISIEKIDNDKFYFKCKNLYYLMEYTDEFRPLKVAKKIK